MSPGHPRLSVRILKWIHPALERKNVITRVAHDAKILGFGVMQGLLWCSWVGWKFMTPVHEHARLFNVAILYTEHVRSNLAVTGTFVRLTNVPAEHVCMDTLDALPSHARDSWHLLH
jgi:hypothetical protein